MSNRNAISQRLGLALVLALGFGVVLGIAVGWGWAIIQSFHHRPYVQEELEVRSDGTPIIHRTADEIGTYHTLDGKEIAVPKDKEPLLAADLSPLLKPNLFTACAKGSDRIDGFNDLRTPPGSWYFVHDGQIAGSGYFVGFDGKSKLCTGYLGRAGFRPDVPPAEEWFAVDGRKMDEGQGQVFSRWVSYSPNRYTSYNRNRYAHEWDEGIPSWKVAMISDNRVWLVDFREPSVTVLMESPELVSIGTFHPAEPAGADQEAESAPQRQPRQNPQMPKLFAVRTLEQILVLDSSGKQLRSYQVPAELRDKTCAFYELSNTSALLAWGRMLPDFTSRKELWWIDNAGKVVRQKELALLPGAKPRDGRAEMWVAAVAVPVPIVWTFSVFILATLELIIAGREPDYASALARILPEMWAPLLAVFVLAAVLAWLCYRWNKRYALGGTWAWVIFVFLTGVPGMLAYRFHRRWPVLEKCPTCTHVVPHDREACADCGTEFPPPKPKGMEVFA